VAERHTLVVSGGAPKSFVMVYGPHDEEKLETTLSGSSRSQRWRRLGDPSWIIVQYRNLSRNAQIDEIVVI